MVKRCEIKVGRLTRPARATQDVTLASDYVLTNLTITQTDDRRNRERLCNSQAQVVGDSIQDGRLSNPLSPSQEPGRGASDHPSGVVDGFVAQADPARVSWPSSGASSLSFDVDKVAQARARRHLEQWARREEAKSDPTDPGFINASISARDPENDPSEAIYRTEPHPEGETPVAVGVIKPGGVSVGKQDKTAVRRPPSDATRGVVTGRSRKSRRRLMEYLAGVDMSNVAAERKAARYIKSAFITLTYPEAFPGWRQAKDDLRALKERFRRHEDYSFSWAVWVEEFQERGAVHFHFPIVFKNPVDLYALRPWLSESWYEVVGSEDPKHLQAGTQAVALHLEQGVGCLMGYLAGELGKIKQTRPVDPETGELIETGRTWGFWGKDAVPFETIASVAFWTWEAWETFKRRVSEYYKKSFYLRRVSGFRSWAGALLYGEGGELLKILIEGIPGVEIRRPGRIDLNIGTVL